MEARTASKKISKPKQTKKVTAKPKAQPVEDVFEFEDDFEGVENNIPKLQKVKLSTITKDKYGKCCVCGNEELWTSIGNLDYVEFWGEDGKLANVVRYAITKGLINDFSIFCPETGDFKGFCHRYCYFKYWRQWESKHAPAQPTPAQPAQKEENKLIFHDYYNPKYCHDLYKNAPEKTITVRNKKIIETDYKLVRKYIKHYFIQVEGGFFMKEKDKYVFKDKHIIETTYLTKMPDIKKWFLNDYPKVRRVISDVNQPKLTDECYNTFGGYMYEKKDYNSYPEEIKKKVELFNSYVLEVLCNNNKEHFIHLVKWYACALIGKKNDACPYLKGPEGTGKSTCIEFMVNYVFGKNISLILTDAEVLLSKNNSILMGNLLVVFEELPVFSDSQWNGVSSKLKGWITGDQYNIGEMRVKQETVKNINNYVINTNVEAIKHSEGRRYYILDVSTKRQQDFEYFGRIKKECFNKEVGEAYFNYLMSMDLTGYLPQNFPETESKKDMKAHNLDNEYKFLLHEFILKEQDMKNTITELHEMYESFYYTLNQTRKMANSIQFKRKLTEIGLTPHRTADRREYRITHQELRKIFEKKDWIHELEVEKFQHQQKKLDSEDDREIIFWKNKCKAYELEIEELKRKQIELFHLLDKRNEASQNTVVDEEKDIKMAPVKESSTETESTEKVSRQCIDCKKKFKTSNKNFTVCTKCKNKPVEKPTEPIEEDIPELPLVRRKLPRKLTTFLGDDEDTVDKEVKSNIKFLPVATNENNDVISDEITENVMEELEMILNM